VIAKNALAIEVKASSKHAKVAVLIWHMYNTISAQSIDVTALRSPIKTNSQAKWADRQCSHAMQAGTAWCAWRQCQHTWMRKHTNNQMNEWQND
jgi:hypothetical protein